MQVNKIILTLRYSKELMPGTWKSIEVGAEAVPSADQSWQEQQRELYAELAGQLKTLFTNNSARPAQIGAPGEDSVSNQPAPDQSPDPDPERSEGEEEGTDEVADA